MSKHGATLQVAMIEHPDNKASSWFESEDDARRDLEASHQDYDFSIVTARLLDASGKEIGIWDPTASRWGGPQAAWSMPEPALQIPLDAVPQDAGTSMVTLVRSMVEAGQFIGMSVEHRIATTKGWHEGWFASVNFYYKPADRDGDHTCVTLGHSMEGRSRPRLTPSRRQPNTSNNARKARWNVSEQDDKRVHAAAKAYTDKSVEQLLAAPSILDFDPDVTMQRHLASMAAALAAADAVPSAACRECGCTDDNACEGGCYWVEPDLCSACADPEWGGR